MKNFNILIVLLFVSLGFSGCMPAFFTAATGSAIAASKDQEISATIRDAKISTLIKTKLMKENFRDLYTKINVEVCGSRVLYTGQVENEENILTAINIAWAQKGVTEVINELKISDQSRKFDLAQFTRDSLITSQIKAKIFINRSLKFSNYTIVTNKDVVYLFGIARSSDELTKVSEIASLVKGVKKVISYVKIKDQNIAEDSIVDDIILQDDTMLNAN